jgi:hypothetical protein
MSVLDDLEALVSPAFWHCPEYVETLGPEVADMMTLFGRTPNPEQRLLLDGAFGMNKRGALTAFEVFVLASRQNLKTGFFEFRALGKALLLQRPVQIWTAHKESATDQAILDFKEMIDASDELSRRVKRFTEGKGSKQLEFMNGCNIVFRPRTGKAGQSMSADDVDLDEYFAVTPSHLGSLMPTLSTRPRAQLGGASSAPHADSNSQRAMMARGRAAAEGRSNEPRLLYGEWSIQRQVGMTLTGEPIYGPAPCKHEKCTHELGSEGCIADSREMIKLANPSAGRAAPPAISWEYLEDERRSLSAEPDAITVYFRERLSSGDEGLDATSMTIFGPASVWQRGQQLLVADGVGAIGVAMSADRRWIGLTGASMVEILEDENDEEAEPVDRMLVAPILHTTNVEEAKLLLKKLQDKHDCAIVLDENGPAAALLDDFEDFDIAIEQMSLRGYATASAKFSDRVTAVDIAGKPTPTLIHLVNKELDEQVAIASWRWVSDNRIIGRRDGSESVDITLLEAGIMAAAEAEKSSTFNIN